LHFGDVPKKVRVFSLKKLFLKRFTVGSTTRTLITDKTDHSAFTAIISIQIPALVLYYYEEAGVTLPTDEGDVTKKVRVFSLKKLFLRRFTVRSTTRTLIIDKKTITQPSQLF
jgi:lipopolysaccharide export system protein LptC